MLETKNGIVAEVGEVISADEFYDFDSKYNNAASVTTTSPDVSADVVEEIRRQAIAIFKILDCKSLSRVDFFLDKDSGELIFNEINTLPGFTNISMFPMLVSKRGYDPEKLIDALMAGGTFEDEEDAIKLIKSNFDIYDPNQICKHVAI